MGPFPKRDVYLMSACRWVFWGRALGPGFFAMTKNDIFDQQFKFGPKIGDKKPPEAMPKDVPGGWVYPQPVTMPPKYYFSIY